VAHVKTTSGTAATSGDVLLVGGQPVPLVRVLDCAWRACRQLDDVADRATLLVGVVLAFPAPAADDDAQAVPA
jgi:hypothetical protein